MQLVKQMYAQKQWLIQDRFSTRQHAHAQKTTLPPDKSNPEHCPCLLLVQKPE